MRKALLENENVGKIAEDPKKLAFLRAIEDREGDEDLDFLEQQQPEEPESQVDMVADSQENANKEAEVQGPTAITTEDPNKTLGKRKRPLGESLLPGNAANMRPPPAARRTHVPRKPATLAEIRASVSFLIEEPDAVPVQPPSSSPVHSEHEGDENGNHGRNDPKNPFQSRRTSSNPIIDRLSLKRESSSTVSAATAGSSDARMAFAADAASSHVPQFKVPSLIRRATSSMSGALGSMNGEDANGISTLAVTERAAGGGEKDVLVVKKKGGRGRSSINWCAREKEKVEKGVEQGRRRERERGRIKAAKGLGSLVGSGAWE